MSGGVESKSRKVVVEEKTITFWLSRNVIFIVDKIRSRGPRGTLLIIEGGGPIKSRSTEPTGKV